MRARLVVNLLLLLAIIALGTVYYLQPEEQSEPPTKVSNLDTDTITSLRIERPDAATIELQKTDGDWRLTAPIQADAEDGRVASILLLPIMDSESRYPATDQKLDKFGLSPAELRLTFNGQTFVIGDQHPLNEQQRYLLHDDQIHVIDDRLHQRLSAPLNYYVNPSLTPADSQLTRIRLPNGVISQQDENWRIIPGSLSDHPDTIARAWQEARASYLQQMDEPPDESRPTITLEFANHEPITYRIVKTKPQIILARPATSMQYHLRPDQGVKLKLIEEPAQPPESQGTQPIPPAL